MTLIFRLIRMIFPLIIFYVVGMFIRNALAIYRYRNGKGFGDFFRDGGSPGYRGFQDRGQQRHRSTGSESLNRRSPYEVLGCSRSSSVEEIKRAYRDLIGTYHPDKFVGMNLDEEFIRLASRRFQEIQSAYETIRRERGF
ncbi:MAG: hypothetical protein CSA35_03535 [Dethiosulfovibrio peptidovorans]|nr:MAG: hypothetical protein CSA35_03535 [Dethiosulfovibrio peptidovorans]